MFARLRLPKVPVREPEVLKDEEITRVIGLYNPNCATGLRNIILVLTLADTGLRLGELCEAVLEDLDLERATLKVMGKGRRERTVHMGATVQKLLSRYLRSLRPEPISARVNNILLAQDGGPLTNDAAKSLLARASVMAGVKRLHAHLLRHTFATNYLLNGGDLLTLQRLLGHSTLEMVQRYAHVAASYVAVQHRQYSPVDRIPVRLALRRTRPKVTARAGPKSRRQTPPKAQGPWPRLHVVGGRTPSR